MELACAPEHEAAVFEAVEPPPCRPWPAIAGLPASSASCAPCTSAATTSGAAQAAACAAGGGSCAPTCTRGGGASGGCLLAVAVGADNAGIHARLAKWGAELAALVPGAQLFRCVGWGGAVGRAAAGSGRRSVLPCGR